MSEPTTQAGRDLLTAIKGALLDPALSSFLGSTGKPELVAIVSLPLLERVIPDIEREAAAAERERLIANLDRLSPTFTPEQRAAASAVLFLSDDVPDEAHVERYRTVIAPALADAPAKEDSHE